MATIDGSMSETDFKKFVELVKYKPGWHFTVKIPLEYDYCVLYVLARVPDVNNPERLTEVYQSKMVSLREIELGPEVWMHIIHSTIVQLELHEVDEWLFICGARVNEPHPK